MDVAENFEKVRKEKPLVHHITNWVTIYDCANIVRAFGALPVMAHAREEVEDMTGIAGALVLNIGTLTSKLVESMVLAGKKANKKGIPVVLDAVGVGATPFRNEKAAELLEKVKIDVVKGNTSEIAALAGFEAETKGVESMGASESPVEITRELAKARKCVAVITGKEDVVSGNGKTYLVKNGHSMMGEFVGSGCMSASVIGSFAAVEKDFAAAATAALSCFGIAGELAEKNSRGPASYKNNLFDEVYSLDSEKINEMKKIELVE